MFSLAILLAAFSAIGLSVGTHLQHRAVQLASSAQRVSILRAARNPLWLLGLAILVLQTMLNVIALGLAPVAVVQPVGSLALVCSVIISSLALGVRVRGGLLLGIGICVVSIAGFVGVSAGFAVEVRPSADTAALLSWLLLCLILLGVLVAHRCRGHLLRVAGAGVIFGTVASAAHVVALQMVSWWNGERPGAEAARLLARDGRLGEDPISASQVWQLAVLLIVASAVGMWLVQTAYASGPPETVLAGLTVLDPLIAVAIGGLLLGEYSEVSPAGLAGLLCSGIAACWGIVVIARHHPSLRQRDDPPPSARSGGVAMTVRPDAASELLARVNGASGRAGGSGAIPRNRRS